MTTIYCLWCDGSDQLNVKETELVERMHGLYYCERCWSTDAAQIKESYLFRRTKEQVLALYDREERTKRIMSMYRLGMIPINQAREMIERLP